MTRGMADLRLHEQLMLMVLKDEDGTPESKAGMYSFALGGAILSELVLADCLDIEESGKHLVDLVEVKPMHEPILDECLGLVASAKRRRRASDWVSRFAHVKKLSHRVAEGLCRRGILQDSEKSVLLIFKRKAYPTIDPGPEKRIVERLEQALRSDEEVDPATAVLVALANGTGMLRVYFDKATLKSRKDRLERIANGELVAGATREAVAAAQAAILAATMAAATVTTITAGH